MGAGKVRVGVAFFAIGCLLFFPLFFSLTYPEIRRNTEFLPANCTTISSALRPYRHCSLGSCQCAESIADPSCSDRAARNRAYNVYDVSQQTMSLIAGYCGDGYSCCSTCCDTCRKCSVTSTADGDDSSQPQQQPQTEQTVLVTAYGPVPASGVRRGGRRLETCRTYSCNCHCCRYVLDELCYYSCSPYYQATALISFTFSGRPVTTLYVVDFASSFSDAQAFLSSAEMQPNVTSDCWYDPTWSVGSQITDSDLVYQRQLGYSWWKWMLSSLGMICLVVSFIYCTHSCIVRPCLPSSISDKSSLAAAISFAGWIGFFMPIVVFLPVRLFGKLGSASAAFALEVLICVFLAVGWAPMIYAIYRRAASFYAPIALGFTFFAFVLPVCVAAPLALRAPQLVRDSVIDVPGQRSVTAALICGVFACNIGFAMLVRACQGCCRGRSEGFSTPLMKPHSFHDEQQQQQQQQQQQDYQQHQQPVYQATVAYGDEPAAEYAPTAPPLPPLDYAPTAPSLPAATNYVVSSPYPPPMPQTYVAYAPGTH